MHRKLLEEAFKKAEKETQSHKVTHLSIYLSDYIVEDSKEPYGERVLRDHYNKLMNHPEERIHIKAHAATSLSHFLGFSSFSDFIKQHPTEITDNVTKTRSFFNKHKRTISIVIIVIIGIYIVNSVTKQRWMVWQENHYVEVDFDTETYKLNQLKLFKKERITSFKKIEPSCDYPFFDNQGHVKVWYGKNKDKTIDYFTALGLHPETGKTLKPITTYMIDKYICN
ncbi:hypothetical protein [Winogradskyella sp. PC D3.3]